jgi:ligand-binding sensor domain-containing protein
MKKLLCSLFVFSLSILSNAQQASNWKNYTSMQTAQAVALSNNNIIWAATTGGGFSYNPSSKIYKTLHRTDGLQGINLTAVTVDIYGKVWFGSLEGVIDVYNPADNSIQSILDIYNSNYNVKQITGLKSSGDTIFVSTSYGISLINAQTLLFIDTYFTFGNLSRIQVNSVSINNNLLYASTVQGLAIQKAGATNLSAPGSWNVYDSTDGLPSSYIYKVVSYNGSLIAGTANGLAIFNGTGWQPFQTQINTKVYDLFVNNDTLYILSRGLISVYAGNSIINSYTLNSISVMLAYSNSLGLLSADSSNGIIQVFNTSNNASIFPNGPAANLFMNLAVDNNGILWCASGTDATLKGFYKYDGNTWTNYNEANTPGLISDAFFNVYVAPDNSVYFGTWGEGYTKIVNGNIQNFDSTSELSGALINNKPNDTTFIVISGLGVDSKNNLWVLNWGPLNLDVLNMLTPGNTWYHYNVPAAGTHYIDYNNYLVIDQYDTKWFGNPITSNAGLYYFNENGSYTNLSNEVDGYISTSNGLTNNSISSIVMDALGNIWVGTGLGASILSNTQGILPGATTNLSITSAYALDEYSITCMAVDPINQKWVGTNNGLVLCNADGSQLLASYTTQNSPLMSNNITSIAIDKNTGTVYVGTNSGLTSFQTPSVQPKQGFTKLFVYPSPFVLKNGTNQLTIDGLVSNSSIKIITLNGKLVKEFPSPGGRVAYWDGTDSNGKLVASGIYIVVAYDQNNNVVTGKIAVLHQ